MSVTVQVENLRRGPFGNALAFFNVVVGVEDGDEFQPALSLRDFVLKEKNDGTAYYFQAPAKQRLKGGEAVKDDKGYPIWDAYIQFITEKVRGSERARLTDLSASIRDSILEQAVAAYESAAEENQGRGATKAKAPAAKAPVRAAAPKAKATAGATRSKARPVVEETVDEALEDEDDSLPF